MKYDAFLLVSFGGPEGPDEVMPFLENVLRGKNVPRERMLEVAEHYKHFGGVSPINEQNRKLMAAIRENFAAHGLDLPVYWGNRNWNPMLPDALREMKADGVKRSLAFFTSAFSCYSGCRQYRENIQVARDEVGEGAPEVDKLRMFFNHPGFVEPFAENVAKALANLTDADRSSVPLVFTAHSIPMSMADNCRYELQLKESCRLVAEAVGNDNWTLVYQSRSGPPGQPWLEPDICDHIREQHAVSKMQQLVVAPIGFVSDHMEVLFDLDTEANDLCKELGVEMQRAATVGTHPRFVDMIRELVIERMNDSAIRPTLGTFGPSHDVCPVDCCTYTPRRPG